MIDEIIVVDDGSFDETQAVVKQFNPKVRYLSNMKNKGKAYSMNKGIMDTDAGVIFFCDADLVGLTPDTISQIVRPVKDGNCDMFVGLRDIPSNRLGLCLLSGQRAIRRRIWDNMPNFCKKGFRVEIGLNSCARSWGTKVFDYDQTAKENKYGFMQGLYRRFFMGLDLLTAFIYIFWTRKRRQMKNENQII